MNLSNASKIRFNGVDIKLAKINGVVVYRKEEEDPLLLTRYTTNTSGVSPVFNSTFDGYEIEEVNDNGVYTVTVRTNNADNLPSQMKFQDNSGLLTVEYLNTRNLTTMNNMFRGCSNLVSVNTSNWNTTRVTDMYGAFYGCSKLTSLDLSDWDTSNVYTMVSMFANCVVLTSLDLSNFNTSRLTSMGTMFYGCTKLASVDLSNWDTSSVIGMNGLFQSCTNLITLNLSDFDVSNVSSMPNMFEGCGALTSLDSMMNISTDLTLPSKLNQESVLDVIDNLATVTTTKTLKLTSAQLSWVSEDKIKEANDKGWTISV